MDHTREEHVEDTIAAIATPPGEGAVAIVRVSGPGSMTVADRVFRCPPPAPSARPGHTFVHGRVLDAGGEEVDNALLLLFRAPHSYTGEDVIELHGHGGRVCARRMLEAVCRAGCRPADPGEFTRRAFLAGKLDLVQAEAVADLVRAQSDRAARAAVEQLEGALSRRINRLYDALLAVAADLEASLDFPEDELPETVLGELADRLGAAREEVVALLGTWNEGRILREGLRVAILGRSNAGKSTLFNLLLGTERAIVSPEPGTTRDALEETLTIEGMPIRLIDTAGLRESESAVEREGISRSHRHRASSDLILYVIDGSEPPHPTDMIFLDSEDASRAAVVLSKADLPTRLTELDIPVTHLIQLSLLDIDSESALVAFLREILHGSHVTDHPPHAGISERHRALLARAETDIREALSLLESSDEAAIVPAATWLRSATEQVGAVTGRHYHTDLLEAIFSRFCIGK